MKLSARSAAIYRFNAFRGHPRRKMILVKYSIIFVTESKEKFFAGRHISETKWTLYKVNGSYDTEIFGTFNMNPTWLAANIEFGPDGAMYVMEWDQANSNVVISRITAIPEPASLLLVGLGGLLVRRKK